MIQLEKKEEPKLLSKNKDEWTDDYIKWIKDKQLPKTVKKRYNKDDIKEKLKEETNSKCAYCESRISDVAYENIEHIKPKSKYPGHFADWNNLTLVCPKCNNEKSDEYNENCPPINPYNEDPSNHFKIAGPMMNYKSNRGRYTRELLKLNRIPLIQSRIRAINRVEKMINSIRNSSSYEECIGLIKELERLISRDKEYTFTKRKYTEKRIDTDNICERVVS